MGQISKVLRSVEGSRLMYWCQGCEQMHVIDYSPGRWSWDGNVEMPTISPSVLVTSGHYVTEPRGMKSPCHDDGDHSACFRCHTFIKAGQVQFLSDCTHQYAGQTRPLPDLPEHMRDQVSP